MRWWNFDCQKKLNIVLQYAKQYPSQTSRHFWKKSWIRWLWRTWNWSVQKSKLLSMSGKRRHCTSQNHSRGWSFGLCRSRCCSIVALLFRRQCAHCCQYVRAPLLDGVWVMISLWTYFFPFPKHVNNIEVEFSSRNLCETRWYLFANFNPHHPSSALLNHAFCLWRCRPFCNCCAVSKPATLRGHGLQPFTAHSPPRKQWFRRIRCQRRKPTAHVRLQLHTYYDFFHTTCKSFRTACFFHVFFKLSALLSYLLCTLVTDKFILGIFLFQCTIVH